MKNLPVLKYKLPKRLGVLKPLTTLSSLNSGTRITSLVMSTKQAVNFEELPNDEKQKFFDKFDVVLTDCDGVIWMEDGVVAGAPDVINHLRDKGKKICLVTNNSTKTREEFLKKAQRMGFKCSLEEIMSTSYLAATYLHNLNFKKKVYIVGSSGIAQELEAVGIKHLGVGPDVLTSSLLKVIESTRLDPDVGAVIAGFDPHISYPKMMKAASYLNNPNCIFIATNMDERFPGGGDIVIPGSGSIVKSIQTCSERTPVLMGKPGTYIYDALKNLYDIDPKRTLMIGDRGNTDILLGTKCGFETMLVLTGVSQLSDVEKWKKSTVQKDQDLIPDYVIPSIADLLRYI